jgi:hypothetical protein
VEYTVQRCGDAPRGFNMLRGLTGVFAAIFRMANSERQSGRTVWMELPDSPPGNGWVSFPAHHPGVRLLEDRGGSAVQVDLVQEADVRVSARRGEPTVRMTFVDGTTEVCRFGGWVRRVRVGLKSPLVAVSAIVGAERLSAKSTTTGTRPVAWRKGDADFRPPSQELTRHSS